jgi:hypothetical protein
MSATIDCTAVAGAGHVVPDGYGPISVQSFLNNVIASENSIPNGSDLNIVRLFSIFSVPYSLLLLMWVTS